MPSSLELQELHVPGQHQTLIEVLAERRRAPGLSDARLRVVWTTPHGLSGAGGMDRLTQLVAQDMQAAHPGNVDFVPLTTKGRWGIAAGAFVFAYALVRFALLAKGKEVSTLMCNTFDTLALGEQREAHQRVGEDERACGDAPSSFGGQRHEVDIAGVSGSACLARRVDHPARPERSRRHGPADATGRARHASRSPRQCRLRAVDHQRTMGHCRRRVRLRLRAGALRAARQGQGCRRVAHQRRRLRQCLSQDDPCSACALARCSLPVVHIHAGKFGHFWYGARPPSPRRSIGSLVQSAAIIVLDSTSRTWSPIGCRRCSTRSRLSTTRRRSASAEPRTPRPTRRYASPASVCWAREEHRRLDRGPGQARDPFRLGGHHRWRRRGREGAGPGEAPRTPLIASAFPAGSIRPRSGRCWRRPAYSRCPFLSEGLPMAILEAFSYGIPVVATPVNAIPDVVEHEKNGLLVPVGDVDALAAALARLLDDAGLRTLSARQQRSSRPHRAIYVRRVYAAHQGYLAGGCGHVILGAAPFVASPIRRPATRGSRVGSHCTFPIPACRFRVSSASQFSPAEKRRRT